MVTSARLHLQRKPKFLKKNDSNPGPPRQCLLLVLDVVEVGRRLKDWVIKEEEVSSSSTD
jgi:hypothetical protein